MRFKLGDLLADEWLADTDFTRGSGEATALNDAHEHTHGLEAIHASILVHPALE